MYKFSFSFRIVTHRNHTRCLYARSYSLTINCPTVVSCRFTLRLQSCFSRPEAEFFFVLGKTRLNVPTCLHFTAGHSVCVHGDSNKESPFLPPPGPPRIGPVNGTITATLFRLGRRGDGGDNRIIRRRLVDHSVPRPTLILIGKLTQNEWERKKWWRAESDRRYM